MHTPGPWTALKCEYGWHIGPQPDGVCSISANRGNGYRLGDEDIQEANARLIAAAPALLEALEKAAERYRLTLATCPDREDYRVEFNQALAAIAAARGEVTA